MSNAIRALKPYLRRKYADNIPGLTALADEVFQTASNEVVITSNSFEGGSAGGTVRYNKLDMLAVIEELLDEWGQAPTTGGRRLMVHADYSGGCAGT